MVSKYTAEERSKIFEAARAAIANAEATLDKPRPPLAEPPVEDKLAKWKREAAEQEERFARERAEPRPLTDYEAAQFQRDTLSGMVAEQKEFLLAVMAEVVAELQHQFETKIAAVTEELGQLRADQTVHRALEAEIVDLPPLPLRKRA